MSVNRVSVISAQYAHLLALASLLFEKDPPKINVKKTKTHQVIACGFVALLTWEASAQSCGLFTFSGNFSVSGIN